MDAPAMFTRKQVPEDVGIRDIGADESAAAGGQGQLHRDDQKEHKPVLKKVKEKMKKIKHTIAGHSSHDHNGDHDDQHGQQQRAYEDDYDGGSSEEEEEEGGAALEREAAMEKGGYMEDVEDKPVAAEPDPEVHGAPMYESERTPAVQDLVAKYDPPARAPAPREAQVADTPGVRFGNLSGAATDVHDPAAQEARRDDPSNVRFGDLGGPVVEDPAAPRSTTPAAREGEDIGTTPVVREFESMSLHDDPAHVGAGKQGARAEEWKDAAAEKLGGASGGAAPPDTDKLKNVAAVPAEYGKKLASTVYEKVAGGGAAAAGAVKRDDERTEAMPVSDAGSAGEEEWKDAPAAADTTTTDRSATGPGYTDKIKSTAAGTTEYGKQLASTVYEKVAGVSAAVAPSLRPQVGQGKPEEGHNEAAPVSDAGVVERKVSELGTEERSGAAGADTTTADRSSTGPGYTDKIKSAAAGTTEYGKQLASTVYEKVAGVSTAVVGKVQQATLSAGTATPGVGAQQQQDTSASATATPGAGGPGNGQDKGVTMTGYIAEKLRPSDEHRELSQSITGTVQRRKEEVGGTVGQRVPAPSQVITKAREAVTSLTGGNRVSETAQPDAAPGAEVKENVATEAPLLRGEDVGEPKLNTNTM